MNKPCLVLTQSREESGYNDFIGRFYHFPEKYLGQFKELPAEFVYYEPTKSGDGVYFGYGRIENQPTADKREDGHYFVEISDYKPFAKPVPFKNETGIIREADSPHYNAQNAVRKLPTLTLDEICLDGKVRLNFKADAHLIKVLGEQLIASEKVGILELIKNAYDAGASYCRVRIENIPGMLPAPESECLFPELSGPVIIIDDDGYGMTRSVIEDGWLRPASTIKTTVKETMRKEREKAAASGRLGSYDKLIDEIKKERGGRIPLGEKGVGRFASHRLGKRLLLTTKTRDLDYEYVLDIDWDQFDSDDGAVKNLDAVGINLYRQKPSRNYGKKGSGTQLVIHGGRKGFSWEPETVGDLQRSISSLNSPQVVQKPDMELPFKAFLECPQIGYTKNDAETLTFPPIFSFDGQIDENGILKYTLKFTPPKSVPMSPETTEDKNFDLRKAKPEHWKKTETEEGFRKPESGPFRLHVDAWYRTGPWIVGPEVDSFTKRLDDFGGVSIFRDGINVFPAEWGAETDWLDLSTRHIKRGRHLSYYNIIGNLEINQENNINLIDKTDREGLIKNKAYNDLVLLTRAAILNILEISFEGKRDQYSKLIGEVVRDPAALKNYAKQGSSLISSIKEKYPFEQDPYDILDSVGKPAERGENLVNLSTSLKNLQKSLDLMKESQEMLTEQAGYGLAVAVSVHEIAKIAANFYTGVSQLLKSDRQDADKLRNLKDASASLQSELKRLSPLRAVRTEARTEFPITKPINFAVEVFRSRFEKMGVEVKVNTKEQFSVYGRYGAFAQVFSNLFDNSCYWLESMPRKNRKIEVLIDAKHRTITVADSGPGIAEVILPYIFEQGYSLKIPPSGLGLYICKHYMHSMRGDIYLTLDRERINELSGAQFTLDLGKVESERPIAKK
ncbi:MAG: sensor histidine kinase [Candidatus Parcubacteria bacterium]|nr:sensor histidine kinase [Candidatus Parcubacteria bacterium]